MTIYILFLFFLIASGLAFNERSYSSALIIGGIYLVVTTVVSLITGIPGPVMFIIDNPITGVFAAAMYILAGLVVGIYEWKDMMRAAVEILNKSIENYGDVVLSNDGKARFKSKYARDRFFDGYYNDIKNNIGINKVEASGNKVVISALILIWPTLLVINVFTKYIARIPKIMYSWIGVFFEDITRSIIGNSPEELIDKNIEKEGDAKVEDSKVLTNGDSLDIFKNNLSK